MLHQKTTPNVTNAMQFLVILAKQKNFFRFDAEVTYIIDKFGKADYPLQFINNIVHDFIKSTNIEKIQYY